MSLKRFLLASVLAWSCVDNNTSDPCPQYCIDIAQTCTANDSQYPSTDNSATCIRICGAINTVPEAGTNTIACRELNVSSAKDETDPNAKHQDCVGAGISAINCGASQCEAFCAADLALCTGTNAVFKTVDECVTACAAWGTSFDGALIGSTGDTLQCRTYHLELSQTGIAADLITHCAHTGVVSARCNNDGDAGPSDAGPSDAGADGPSDAAGD
ncbi:MAG TPA: hypothetical protein VGH87_01465 [Polyangiaceae bacterium]